MLEICPILSLGIYWACFGFDSQETKLFPGANQYDRFRKLLHHFVRNDGVLTELERRGVVAENLGTHSMRKGSATFASSGSTSCPSTMSISLRAGWTNKGVHDTYMRYEAAGDHYVGRTVCGLPTDKAEFAMLPPHFSSDISQELVSSAINVVFPEIPQRLRFVGEYALASIVFHRTFLENLLGHPILGIYHVIISY